MAFSNSVLAQPPAPKLFWPAHHDQPAAQLFRVAHEHVDLLVGKAADAGGVLAAGARHVGQNHRVVVLQLGQRGEQLVARLHDDLQSLVAQPLD